MQASNKSPEGTKCEFQTHTDNSVTHQDGCHWRKPRGREKIPEAQVWTREL